MTSLRRGRGADSRGRGAPAWTRWGRVTELRAPAWWSRTAAPGSWRCGERASRRGTDRRGAGLAPLPEERPRVGRGAVPPGRRVVAGLRRRRGGGVTAARRRGGAEGGAVWLLAAERRACGRVAVRRASGGRASGGAVGVRAGGGATVRWRRAEGAWGCGPSARVCVKGRPVWLSVGAACLSCATIQGTRQRQCLPCA
jgi:hypothetical protein